MTTIDFRDNGTTFTGPVYDLDGVTITGSADVIDSNFTLGIAGGNRDFNGNFTGVLDPGEVIVFTFDELVTNVSYRVNLAFDRDSDGITGEVTIEAFGADGSTLGKQNASGLEGNVSTRFGGVPISKFQVTATDAMSIRSLSFTPPNQPPTAVNFLNTTTALDETSDTTDRIKVADIAITDDGQGNNNLSLSGSDVDAFELDGTVLYLKASTTLDYESGKTSYSVTVNVDDPAVGNTPDASNTFTLSINNVNENLPPIAQNDLITTDANTPITFNLFADNGNGPDSDPNGDTFRVSDTDYSNFQGNITVFFEPGSAFFDPAGVFNNLAAGETATTRFTYTITDGSAISDAATVTITVTGVNDTPTDLTLSNTTIAENSDLGTVIGSFSTVDPDTSNTTFTYSLVDAANFPDNSAFTITDNQLRVNTNLDFETKSSYNIRVKTTDAGGLSFEKVLTIGVNDLPENRTPTAVNDSVNAYKGVPTTIAASTLLANDTDPDAGTTLQITGVSNATNGTVSLNSSGNVVFTATNTGNASFQYTLSDGSLTSTATVAVSVGLSLNGGNGIDILKGSDRDDLINGNGGADVLYGNNGKDSLNGGNGLDLLLGGEGDDLLNGGDSADILYGGKGNDTLTGGSSKDIFAFIAGDGSDTITDFADGSDKIGLVGLRFSQLTISASGSNTAIRSGTTTLATLTGVSSNLITAADFVTL